VRKEYKNVSRNKGDIPPYRKLTANAGGQDYAASPDASTHGASEALASMHHGGSVNGSFGSNLGSRGSPGNEAASLKLQSSNSHANLTHSLKAMTRQAPSSVNLLNALGGSSYGLSTGQSLICCAVPGSKTEHTSILGMHSSNLASVQGFLC
jgi:hypothetical protein